MKLVGVDLGIHKVSCALFAPGITQFDLQIFNHDAGNLEGTDQPATRATQLWQLSRYVLDTVCLHEADSVWIEDTIIGNNRKYSIGLAQAMGAVLSSLALVQSSCDVRLVDNKQWKKTIIGSGNASKEAIKNYIIDTHPVYAALCEDEHDPAGSQDAYDACCIGLYGLTVISRAEHLVL